MKYKQKPVSEQNTMIDMQKTDEPVDNNPKEGLHESSDASLTERGGYQSHVAESSVYTKASLHPVATPAAIGLGLGAAAYAVGRRFKAAGADSDADPPIKRTGIVY